MCRVKPQTFLNKHPSADIVLDPRLKTVNDDDDDDDDDEVMLNVLGCQLTY